MQKKWFSLMLAVPLLAMTTPTFAQSLPAGPPVPSPVHTLPPVSHASPVLEPVTQVVGNVPSADMKNLPLPVAQLQQTITVVNANITQSARGLVSVTPPVLQQAGLSAQEIQWAETQIAGYNNNLTFAPRNHDKFRPRKNAETRMNTGIFGIIRCRPNSPKME